MRYSKRSKLSDENWEELLQKQPQFAEKRK